VHQHYEKHCRSILQTEAERDKYTRQDAARKQMQKMFTSLNDKVYGLDTSVKRPIDPRSEQTKAEMDYLQGSFDQRGKAKRM
jgi:hypothetical protein